MYNNSMVELIKRKDVFDNYKIIASEIAGIQKALFDDSIYISIEDDNEKMEYKNKYDAMDYEEETQKYNIKILTIGHNNIKTFTKILYEILSKLFEELEINCFFILADFKINYFDLLYNKYKPLTKAYRKLEESIGIKYYDEAFCLNKLSEEIVDIIFWLSRCSPQMNNIMFFDKKEKYYLNICQYGNIHFTGLNENTVSEKIMNKIGLKIIDGVEKDNFTNDGKISGRRIKV
jgi:hypothetical protein